MAADRSPTAPKEACRATSSRTIVSPAASPRSPSPPPSPSTPRPRRCRPQGENVIGFGAGEPDFPTPEHIVEAAVAACRDPRNHRYTPAGGLPELREAIAAKTKRDSGFDCTAAQVLVTNGGKHAVFTAFAALCDPGRRGDLPGAVLDDVPRGDHPRRRRAEGRSRRPRRPASRSPSTSSRRRGRRAPRCCCSSAPTTRRVRCTRPRRSRRSAGGRSSAGVWVVTDEIYEHLTYGPHEFALDADARARSRRAVRRRQRRRQDVRDDRVAGRAG